MFKIIYLLTFIFSGTVYSNGTAAHQGSAHSTVSENANSPDPNDLSQQLIEAIRSGSYADVQNLIEAGVDVNAPDEYGNEPLKVAAIAIEVKRFERSGIVDEERLDIFHLLFIYSSVRNADEDMKALMWAAKKRYLEDMQPVEDMQTVELLQ